MDRRLVKRKHDAETKKRLSKRSRKDFPVDREDRSDGRITQQPLIPCIVKDLS